MASNSAESIEVIDIDDSDATIDFSPLTPNRQQPAEVTRSLSLAHTVSDSDTDSDELSAKGVSEKIGDKPVASHSTADTRPVCHYGSDCYRKNPVHFEEYRHENKFASGNKRTSDAENSADELTDKKARLDGDDDGILATAAAAAAADDDDADLIKSGARIIAEAQPLSFMLTKVKGIPHRFNSFHAIDKKDILAPSVGNLLRSAQFNYCIDIRWLVSRYPIQFRRRPLLVVHGEQRRSKVQLDAEAASFDHVTLCQARLEMAYGTHHTKMMLLLYDDGLRVVIHTANLIEEDWLQKTQGVWVSPLFPQMDRPDYSGDSVTHFKHDLLQYISAYQKAQLNEWRQLILSHDMSSAKVFIVASVPGRHRSNTREAFGHLKLRKILQSNGPEKQTVSGWPLIGQFSSIGSLGVSSDVWLRKEWLQSMSSCKDTDGSAATKLQLVYPSKEDVRLSLEGYMAGGSLPYSINTAKKQPYLIEFLHRWVSESQGRTRASPHIKTYMRYSPGSSDLAWFLVTNANLSKAAWGSLEKNESQLMIRSYEMGVLFLPTMFCTEKTFHVGRTDQSGGGQSKHVLTFPLPFDLPLTPYTSQDRPWIVDVPYLDKPDTHQRSWNPS